MNKEKVINTDIRGAQIIFERTVSDKRGVFFELVQDGFNENIFKGGVRNVYATMATTKLLARAGHYHFENFENFYPLSGTAIWVLLDCRKESKTYGNLFSFITSFQDYFSEGQISFSIQKNQFAHIIIPQGVYHLFAPLTEESVIVIATGSVPYKKEDYGQPEKTLMDKLRAFTSKYGIIYP